MRGAHESRACRSCLGINDSNLIVSLKNKGANAQWSLRQSFCWKHRVRFVVNLQLGLSNVGNVTECRNSVSTRIIGSAWLRWRAGAGWPCGPLPLNYCFSTWKALCFYSGWKKKHVRLNKESQIPADTIAVLRLPVTCGLYPLRASTASWKPNKRSA